LSVNQYGLLEVLHLPYSPDVAPSDFHFFCLPNRSSSWKSFQVTSGVKGGGAWQADTATKKLPIPRNLCQSGTL